MKKALLFALALVAAGCAEPEPTPKNASELVQQGDVLLDGETMMPYSGPVFELYSDEQVVRSRSTLKNGVLDGVMEMYNKSGQTIMRIAVKGDSMYQPDGPYEVYYNLNEYETVPINTNGLQYKTTIEDGEE
jgi:hypothetical protein